MSERPWIEHDGTGCPLKSGTRLVAKFLNPISGEIEIHSGVAGSGLGRSWAWTSGVPEWCERGLIGQIIAYRLHDDGQSESERRAERMERFRKIAAGKEHLIEETLKPRERV